MKVVLSDPAAIAAADAPPAVRKAFRKQLAFLENDLRHPSLRAKKYDVAKNRWQARVLGIGAFISRSKATPITSKISSLIPNSKPGGPCRI